MDVPVTKRQSLQTTEWQSGFIYVQEVGTGYVTAYETGHHHRTGQGEGLSAREGLVKTWLSSFSMWLTEWWGEYVTSTS